MRQRYSTRCGVGISTTCAVQALTKPNLWPKLHVVDTIIILRCNTKTCVKQDLKEVTPQRAPPARRALSRSLQQSHLQELHLRCWQHLQLHSLLRPSLRSSASLRTSLTPTTSSRTSPTPTTSSRPSRDHLQGQTKKNIFSNSLESQ